MLRKCGGLYSNVHPQWFQLGPYEDAAQVGGNFFIMCRDLCAPHSFLSGRVHLLSILCTGLVWNAQHILSALNVNFDFSGTKNCQNSGFSYVINFFFSNFFLHKNV